MPYLISLETFEAVRERLKSGSRAFSVVAKELGVSVATVAGHAQCVGQEFHGLTGFFQSDGWADGLTSSYASRSRACKGIQEPPRSPTAETIPGS